MTTVNGVTIDYTYNSLDQLISAGSVTYDYDDRGNLHQVIDGSQTTTYSYDAADRLASLTLPDATAITYGYDADGRRIKQTVGSAITNYLWDEASAYGDVVLETDGSGSRLASYVLAGTQVVSQTRGSATSYFLQDGQGSTRALTNGAGAITDTYAYTAFGSLLDQAGNTANGYLYTGQQFDSLTGLYDLRARYYNPALGRFLSQDTYPVNFDNPVELNRYVYTASNPINLTDPTGYAALAEYVTLGAAFGGAAGALSTYACGGNLGENVAIGMLFGAGFGVGLTYAYGATLLFGTGYGLYGAATAFDDMLKNGPNTCNRFNAAISLLGVVLGGKTLIKEFSSGGFRLIGPPSESTVNKPSSVLSASDLIQNLRSRLPNGKTFANLTPQEWRAIIPKEWKIEFSYYRPQQNATVGGVEYNFQNLEFPQWKFVSPDGTVEIRIHSAQPPYDTSWVARIGIQQGVPGTEGLTSFPNVQNPSAPSWIYYNAEGIPTTYQSGPNGMHLPVNGTLSDFISVFPGYYP